MSSDLPTLRAGANGPVVVMPADAAGDREHLSIQAAHARRDALMANEDCEADQCLACQLDDVLNGIR